MKIGFDDSINLQEGKIKYNDQYLNKIINEGHTKKITSFFIEFIKNKFNDRLDLIILKKNKLIDLIIEDIERIDSMILKNENKNHNLLKKCINFLEKEIPISEIKNLEQYENEYIKNLKLNTNKPIILMDDHQECNVEQLMNEIIKITECILFYTIGYKESRVWMIKKNSSILECASHIHTDLANGFIRGEVYNLNECLNKNNEISIHDKQIKIVDKNYIVRQNDVLNIRFSVSKK